MTVLSRAAAVCILCTGLISSALLRDLAHPLSPGRTLPTADRLVGGRYAVQDAAFMAGGMRRLAADAAWVQLLLFLGGGIADEDASGRWPNMAPQSLRVVRLDPGFMRAYTFGAGILAWFRNVDRPDEALELLREGLRNHPNNWEFASMMVAIGYKKRAHYAAMAAELAEIVRRPDCPVLIKSILAGIYKAEGRRREEAALWLDIASSPDGGPYRVRAQRELERLAAQIPMPAKR